MTVQDASRLRRALFSAVGLAVCTPCGAQTAARTPAPTPSPLEVEVALGARGVDVTGDATRYRQDVNLDSGVRVRDLALSYLPARGENAGVDRLDIQASDLGGDPFEAVHVAVQKYGAYDFVLDRRRSQYFYDDTILPTALANLTRATGGDFHTFDFERIRESAKLAIDISPRSKFNVGLQRQTRSGKNTEPRGLQRDQFELTRAIDESLDGLNLGFEHRWSKAVLTLEERAQTFDNAVDLFLPGASLGENASDLATLSFFTLDQSYDYRSRGRTVRASLDPLPRLKLGIAWQGESLELDTSPAERSTGTTPSGTPFATAASGEGAVQRDIDQAGVDLGVRVTDRVRIVGALRDSALAQRGRLRYGPDTSTGTWNIDTAGYETGVEIGLSGKLSVTGGLSSERREAAYVHAFTGTAAADERATRRRGYFGRLAFNPASSLEISASLESNDIDDPFTLSSPTSSERYKVKARQRWKSGWSLTGSLRRTALDNSRSGWSGSTDALNLRTDYGGPRLGASLGVGRVDLGRRIDQTVIGGTRADIFAIDYEADVATVNASVNWRIDSRVTLGTALDRYANRGSFPTDRDDWRAYVGIGLGRDYVMQVTYRDLRYREDFSDDYDARLLELTLRMRW